MCFVYIHAYICIYTLIHTRTHMHKHKCTERTHTLERIRPLVMDGYVVTPSLTFKPQPRAGGHVVKGHVAEGSAVLRGKRSVKVREKRSQAEHDDSARVRSILAKARPKSLLSVEHAPQVEARRAGKLALSAPWWRVE